MEEAQATSFKEIPPFDPGSLKTDHRLVTWEPGREVRFRKPIGLGAVGCAPGLLLFLSGPAVFMVSHGPMDARVLAAVVFGVGGLFLGAFSLLVVQIFAPDTVALDWSERRLTKRGLLSKTSCQFSEIRAINLRCGGTHRRGRSQWFYTVTAQLGGPDVQRKTPKEIEILSTKYYPGDPITPYDMTLPLAAELAKALGVPCVVDEDSLA